MKYLLEKKSASVDVSLDGLFPIHYACITGVVPIVQMVLEKGGVEKMVNKKTPDGYTPLHIAAANEHLKVVLLLLKHKADTLAQARGTGNTPLHVAMRNSGIDVVRVLIAKNDFALKMTNAQGESPVKVAERFKNQKVVEYVTKVLMGQEQPHFETLYLELSRDESMKDSELIQDAMEIMADRVDALLQDQDDLD